VPDSLNSKDRLRHSISVHFRLTEGRSQCQDRWRSLRNSEAQQFISNASQTRHQARRIESCRVSTHAATSLDTFKDDGRPSIDFGVPIRVVQGDAGLQQTLQITEITVTQGVIPEEAASNGSPNGCRDLVPGFGVIEVTKA
jgi:hypothetical protein